MKIEGKKELSCLELKGVYKAYKDKPVLIDCSMEFTPGVYGILGVNGSGKSTMMHLIVDHVKRDQGSIFYNGKEILENRNEFFQDLGYMPQQRAFYEDMIGVAYLHYLGSLKGLRKRERKEEVARVLEIVHLTKEKDQLIKGYSLGMGQRLLLAQALLGSPKVLLLDEPTAGVDPIERERIRSFIKELSKERIILLATHILEDLEAVEAQVIRLRDGKLMDLGMVKDQEVSLQELF